MAKITVHHFRTWDTSEGGWLFPQMKSPADRIEKMARGQIVPGTAEVVDEADLDEHGRDDVNKRASDARR